MRQNPKNPKKYNLKKKMMMKKKKKNGAASQWPQASLLFHLRLMSSSAKSKHSPCIYSIAGRVQCERFGFKTWTVFGWRDEEISLRLVLLWKYKHVLASAYGASYVLCIIWIDYRVRFYSFKQIILYVYILYYIGLRWVVSSGNKFSWNQTKIVVILTRLVCINSMVRFRLIAL